jgi:serine/threonine-protein kinase
MEGIIRPVLNGQDPEARASDTPSAEVVAELDRILASPAFANSERLSRFLKFVVGEALAGRREQIKEYAVGVEVFDRGTAFDPRTDPVVRTEARRLRSKLREYYETDDTRDGVKIDLPKGSYCPVFSGREAVEPVHVPSAPKRRRVGLALIAISFALGLCLVYFAWRQTRRDVVVGRASIAVLPLENLSADPHQEYFADGMTEALITELAKLGTLRVISTTSAMQYKRKKGPLPKIAAELSVNYIVEGSVTKAGNRVRVRAQLIEAPADHHRWADDFDGDLGDILRLQSDVARAIARQIDIQLAQPAQAQPTRLAVRSEAYLAYLQGRYYWYKRTPEGIRRSLEFFKQAVEHDPSSAQAYAGLADAYNLYGSYQLAAPQDVYPQARATDERALQLDEGLPEAHTALAAVLSDYYWDWEQAEKHFKRAIDLNPNYALAHQWYSGFLAYNRKRHADALTHAKLARSLDPLALIAHNNVGFVLYHARDFDGAIEQLRKTRDMDSSFPPTYIHLGLAWIQKRDYAQAIPALETALKLSGDDPQIAAALAYALAASGRTEDARALVRELEQRGARGGKVAMALATAYTGLGDMDRAFHWFENACEERTWLLATTLTEPLYDPLRSDPRFQRLLQRLHLAP